MAEQASKTAPPSSHIHDIFSVTRQAPFPKPEPVESHQISVAAGATSSDLPFPKPADKWVGRDITTKDWSLFVSNILAVTNTHDFDDNKSSTVSKPNDEESRVQEVLAAWNSGFFESRGLRVVTGSTGSGAQRLNFGPDKFGIQLGSGLFGVDMSKKEEESGK